MALLEMETERRKGALKGRETRNQTVNTKLTTTEAAAVESAARAEGKAVGEWLRDVALRELSNRKASPSVMMSELQAVRLLLINTLEPLARGEKMTAEQFKAMLQYVKSNKRKAALDVLASYAERGGE